MWELQIKLELMTLFVNPTRFGDSNRVQRLRRKCFDSDYNMDHVQEWKYLITLMLPLFTPISSPPHLYISITPQSIPCKLTTFTYHPSLMHPWLPFTIIVSFTGHANHFIPISCPPSCIFHYLLLFIQSATKCTLLITPSYHISHLNPSKSLNPSLIYPFPFHTHFTTNAHLSVPIGSMQTLRAHYPSSPHPFSKPIKPIPCSSPSSINISRTYFLSLNLPMHATTLLIPINPLLMADTPLITLYHSSILPLSAHLLW